MSGIKSKYKSLYWQQFMLTAGLVLLTMGRMWGLLVLMCGVVLLMVYYGRLMRGQGYDPEQGSLNGLAGKGKQTPDAVATNQPPVGEQPADIWQQLEQ